MPGSRTTVVVQGNEEADALARESTEMNSEDTVNLHQSICLPSNMSNILKNHILEEAIKHLESTSTTRGYFNRTRVKLVQSWFLGYQYLSRETITLISRIRSHHIGTKEHLKDKNIIDNNNCDCNSAIQTLDHLFFNCPLRKDSLAGITTISRRHRSCLVNCRHSFLQ